MSRYLSWLANGTLLVLCCFLLANTANAVIASWLAPSPDEVAADIAPAAATDRSWSQRQLILDRNLFNASLKASELLLPPTPPTEELETTALPLSLIGTAAMADPTESWAAVQDNDARKHLVLQQGDSVKGKATIERIEPKRIVLRENGELRELALSDEPAPAPRAKKSKRSNRRSAARRAKRPRSRRAARTPTPIPTPAAPPRRSENRLADAAELFSQANLVPKFENGEMVGVQVDAVEPGSFFEAAGIQSGEVITELNGIRISSPEQSQQALAEFAEGDIIKVKILGADGVAKEVELPLNPTQ
ncbi:MAG: PDZ domain-containing protein [Deltaproteobacteria bacterium]|nr:PDZ domain-containing protein [Deltaproteobacteria bacterium]MBW2359893.1 PDZ domain-containing protein [Deltaproteobacteria bacterium]